MAPKPMKLGDVAPEFTLLDQRSFPITLSDYKGKKNVLLIFYPKNKTIGCTRQLTDIQEHLPEIKKLKVAVFGVNPGSKKSHKSFRLLNGFKFPLLVDENAIVARKYHSLKENGKSIERTVIIVNKKGKIAYFERGAPSSEELLEIIPKIK